MSYSTPAPCWRRRASVCEQEAEAQSGTHSTARPREAFVPYRRSASTNVQRSREPAASTLPEAVTAAPGQPNLPVRRAIRCHAAQCLRPRCADDALPLSLASHAALPLGASLTTQILPRRQENEPQLPEGGDPRRRAHHRPGCPCCCPACWRCRQDHSWPVVLQLSHVGVACMSSPHRRSIRRPCPILGRPLHAW